MAIHTLKLIDRYDVALNTKVFVFEKPAGFTFKAGQYGGFTLINPKETDAGGVTRRFSILSSPDDNFIAIATRIQQSAYKRMLDTFVLGDEIKFAGPTGTFVLPDDTKTPIVMLAGGIGITPFYSMIHYAATHNPTQPMFLFYGNQQLNHAAFLKEFTKLSLQNPQFKFIPTFNQSYLISSMLFSRKQSFCFNHFKILHC